MTGVAPLRQPLFALLAIAMLVVTVLSTTTTARAATSDLGDSAAPWPAVWTPYRHADGTTINDLNGDINPSDADIASGVCSGCAGADPSVYYYSDGTTAFFRLRIATDPYDANKGGIFSSAYLVQIAIGGVVKAVVGLDGKQNGQTGDSVYVTSADGSVTDKIYTFPWDGSGGQASQGARVVTAGNGQYFLDFQVPLGRITTRSGGAITATSAIQLFFGTSQAANLAVINKDYMEGSAVSFANLSTVNLQPASVALASSATPTSGPNPPAVGIESQYQVSVTASNPGGSELTSASVSIPLGSGVTASSFTPSVGSVSGSGPYTWTIGTLAPGQSVTLTFTVAVTPAGGDVGAAMTLVAAQGATGTDAPAAATRTDTAAALVTGAVVAVPPSHTVTFDSQGGSAVSSATVVDGDHVSQPSPPTKAHAVFVGWATTAGGGTSWDFANDIVLGDTTLYAIWTPETHTVTFSTGAGSAVSSQVIDWNTMASSPADPTRAGYTFAGWATTNGGSTLWNFGSDPVTADVTLYALWTPVTYTVSFDSQGGTSVASQGVSNGSLAVAPSSPTRAHYVFRGWVLTPSGSTLWNFATDPVTANRTLYASWDPAQYTVVFHTGSGSPVADATVVYGSTISEPTPPTRTGYVFGGWATTSGGSTLWDFSTGTVGGDTELWALWSPISLTVAFDSQGGTSVSSASVTYGSLVTQPTSPSRTGYTFAGWSTAPSGGAAWNFASNTVTSARTLYATWTINTYVVTFVAQGGTATSPAIVEYGSVVPQPGAPTRTGYAFAGWSLDAGGSSPWNFATDAVINSLTLYAVWTPADHTVTFDSQGGSPVASAGSAHGITLAQPSAPTRVGYTFVGWATDPSGGTMWNFASGTVDGDVTLYAIWELAVLTITFDSQGGSVVASTTTTYGGLVNAPVGATRAGYTLVGWFTTPSVGGTNWNFAVMTITANQTLYARWSPNEIAVTLKMAGAADIVITVSSEGVLTVSDPQPVDGQVFLGWSTEPDGEIIEDLSTLQVREGIVLYAHWGPDEDIELAMTGATGLLQLYVAFILLGVGTIITTASRRTVRRASAAAKPL